jgi:nucleoside-diphosphate-sugar epimerase
VASALRDAGHEVLAVRAPRLSLTDREAAGEAGQAELTDLADAFAGCAAVVNAAGNPDPSQTDELALDAANGALAGLVARGARQAQGSPRLVHISSAVVQGRAAVLDDSPATADFSAYARSKVLGERLVLELGPNQTVVYRPPSVHAPDRRVSRTIARIASSPLSIVASPGSRPTPQALIDNVASAVAFLATTPQQPPSIVAHPSEGMTTANLMRYLGGREPHQIPRWLARTGTVALELLGRALPSVAANARRAEMILFGQGQAPSWLTAAGWVPPQGKDAWRALGSAIAHDRSNAHGGLQA